MWRHDPAGYLRNHPPFHLGATLSQLSQRLQVFAFRFLPRRQVNHLKASLPSFTHSSQGHPRPAPTISVLKTIKTPHSFEAPSSNGSSSLPPGIYRLPLFSMFFFPPPLFPALDSRFPWLLAGPTPFWGGNPSATHKAPRPTGASMAVLPPNSGPCDWWACFAYPENIHSGQPKTHFSMPLGSRRPPGTS